VKWGSGLVSMTSGAELEGFTGGKVRRGVEALSGERWSEKTRGVIGSIRGAGGCTGTVDGLCFLEGHPPISIQCLQQTMCAVIGYVSLATTIDKAFSSSLGNGN